MNWKLWVIFSTIICGLVKVTESANILVVIPIPARSHFKSFQPLWEALVERGDNVTLLAGHKLNDKLHSKYTMVDVKPLFSNLKIVFAELRKMSTLAGLKSYNDMYPNYAEKVLEFPDVQKLINSNNEYGLVIAHMFYMDAIFAFGNKFNAPVIAFDAMPALRVNHNWMLGNPLSSTYIPNVFLPFTEKMSLPTRFLNMAFDFLSVLYNEFIFLPRCQMQIEKFFNFSQENIPHIKDITKNISVIFSNSHYSFEYIKPDLPNIVNLAGIHLTPSKILPDNIQKFMDEAEYGVIYLSLGSLIELDKIENLGKIFISAMENLPQRVIMKWDAKLLPHVPKNFYIQEWLPQIDVLNHPKCRLFISHGGWHSIMESLNASVPILGLPFFGDQKRNLAKIEYFETGLALNIDDISNELLPKINEILYNPKYKENIVKRSQLFHERLNTPLKTALYWIDHVLKHKDTSHLRSASTQLAWYELYSVDVLIIIAVIFWVAIKVVKFIVRRILQKLTSVKNVLFPKPKSWHKKKRSDNLKCD